MCDADVRRSPSATNRNSAAKSTPATIPGRSVPSRSDSSSPRIDISNRTSAALMPERRPTCMIGTTSCAASLIATCCAPQIAHRSTIVTTTNPSRSLRIGLVRRVPAADRGGTGG